MGLLERLFGGQASRSADAAPTAGTASQATHTSRDRAQVQILGGSETLDVVGESHYLKELWSIVGQHRPGEPVRFSTVALLVPEPENPYDKNAVKVVIDGLKVGYLARTEAPLYRPGILRLMDDAGGALVGLRADIVGSGDERELLGVFLDHDPVDFGLEPYPAPPVPVRTGWGLAATTDDQDDSYDLSWREKLSPQDSKAIPQLRSLLETERPAISRHYVYCDLEHCLYHSRNDFLSALDDFDAVCEQHAQEMDTIRPALVAKFGGVPVIEMYQQATIRCAKAKRWQDARQWAERGIGVYGDEALRPEVVDDLRKRREHATAKLEKAAQPRPRPGKPSAPS
jgi:hypothetical protein